MPYINDSGSVAFKKNDGNEKSDSLNLDLYVVIPFIE